MAEHVYGGIEPVNYVIYLMNNHRFGEALASLPAVINAAQTQEERADALWHNRRFIGRIKGDLGLALARARIGKSGAAEEIYWIRGDRARRCGSTS